MKFILLFLELSTCYTLPNMMINRIKEVRVPIIVSMEENYLNNDTLNSSLRNIRSLSCYKEDIWLLDLDNSVEEEDTFPSFKEFLKKKQERDEEEVNYLSCKFNIENI